MDRPVSPIFTPQRRALDFALDTLSLRAAHAQVVEDDRVLDLEREVATLRAENARLRAANAALRAEVAALEDAQHPDAEALDAWAREHERRRHHDVDTHTAMPAHSVRDGDRDRLGLTATREADRI